VIRNAANFVAAMAMFAANAASTDFLPPEP
jgi:hypothetical protein